MDFIRKFLGLSKEENELKDVQVFNSCVVDYANIYSLDLTDSFAKIRNLSNNHDLDFSIVVNIRRKDFFDRLDAISLVLRFRPADIEEFIQKHIVRVSDVDEVVDEILSKIS